MISILASIDYVKYFANAFKELDHSENFSIKL